MPEWRALQEKTKETMPGSSAPIARMTASGTLSVLLCCPHARRSSSAGAPTCRSDATVCRHGVSKGGTASRSHLLVQLPAMHVSCMAHLHAPHWAIKGAHLCLVVFVQGMMKAAQTGWLKGLPGPC